MNGNFTSSSAQFINSNASNLDNSGLSFLSGSRSNAIVRGNLNTIFGTNSWTRANKLSSDAAANLYTRAPANNTGFDPWGFRQNTIIDDDEIPSNSEENATEEAAGETSTAEEAVEVSGELATATEVAGSSTPWGLAAIINQQMGQVTSQAITSGLRNQAASDYAQNMLSHGLNVGLNANIIQSQQENTIRNQETGGSIGSLFGPIGALIGHAVAGYASVNADQLKTASSFNGMVNPQQTGIVSSMTTAGSSGEGTQVDNIDAAANG